MRKLFFAAILSVLASNLQAAKVELQPLPDELVQEFTITNYQQCSYERLTIFFMKIYDAFLCKDDISDLNYDKLFTEKFALTIKYWRSFSSTQLSNSSLEEIQRNYVVSEERAKYIVATLAKIFPDVSRKDQISAVYKPIGVVEFYKNSQPIGTINDPEFAEQFMNIWLHPKARFVKSRDRLMANK